jgi:hypothetical protein
MPGKFYQYNDARKLEMSLDITVSPLHRIGGQDQPSLPGLLAAVPPRKAAHGREQDRLLVYLLLAGKAVLSSSEGMHAASRAAVEFYATPGTITSALRAAAESINKYLHDRNLTSPTPGQYAVGMLALAALRESQLTLLLSGPMHGFHLGAAGPRHIFDTLSGRGLGLSETTPYYFSQIGLASGDRLLLCTHPPAAWQAALGETGPGSLDATRRRLMAAISDDVNAVLIAAVMGTGTLTVQRLSTQDKAAALRTSGNAPTAGGPEDASEYPSDTDRRGQELPASAGAAIPGPSAYAIPPDRPDEPPVQIEQAPMSVPRSAAGIGDSSIDPMTTTSRRPPGPSERTRKTAKYVARLLQTSRRAGASVTDHLRTFLPRLLPAAQQSPWSFSTSAMMFVAVLVPLVVVTVASAVYFRYGRSVQYEQYLVQAQDARAQALSLTDAAAQREAWQRELFYLDKADTYNETSEARGLRVQAQQSLDQLQGIVRLEFQPVLNAGVGVQVGRLTASENDLYLLDAQRGAVLHVALLNGGFQVDTAFSCAPGSYGGFTVGPLVDILALPAINSINASVIGSDASGNLLYCAPGQVAQGIPLPPPDTNWGRVKAFTMDAGNLYVLDAEARAVWVYAGKDGAFVDRPYFFFGGQIPELDDAIDLAVNSDDLYVLHADGRVSTCSYSRLEAVPTRCVDPATLLNPFPAYRDLDLFSEAHFTQMIFSPAPDSALLLLDADSQGVFRLAPRSLELQSQMRPLAGRGNSLPAGQVSAMSISPNHILFLALQDRLYFASDVP